MREGLLGWLSPQEPGVSFRKCICTTDRCVVQIFSELFFWGENPERKDQGGKHKDCVGLYFPPRAGGGVWILVFHNNKQTNKKSIVYPLSVFNEKLYSQTKCQTDAGKKVMYPGI